jgi:hypothetical protein
MNVTVKCLVLLRIPKFPGPSVFRKLTVLTGIPQSF